MHWLTMASYALPELFGLGLALVLLATNARPGPGRRLGFIGIALMLSASFAGLGVSVLQTLWIGNADGNLQRMLSALTAARVALNVLSMAGLVTVVWGLCRATRETDAR
jgi:apolipoprotein N-acyltransferase